MGGSRTTGPVGNGCGGGSDPAEVGDDEDGEVVLGAKGREERSCDGSSAE
jgi:hypothetical protein